MEFSSEYFLKRKTCRFFKKEKLSEKVIFDIVEKAAKAPTCGNMQLYSVVVTTDADRLRQLSEYHYNQPAAATATAILTVCADFNRFTKWCDVSKASHGFDNFHSFITAMTDAVIFCQQIVTVAELYGFGTCYLGTVNYNAKEISEFLKLPELVVPVASISIGVAEKDGDDTVRLKPSALIHSEEYKDYSDSDIIDIYKVQEDYPDNKKFVEENGKEYLAQVFAEVRYPKSVNESISKTFFELLKEKGFFRKDSN